MDGTPSLVLYFAPGSCSRVVNIALEESGLPFEGRIMKFMQGEHRSPEYLRLNPKGKIPLLLIDGRPLTENAAIQFALARLAPDARLLPLTGDPEGDARVLADLVWCASGIHPLITRLRLPQFFSEDPQAAPGIVRMAEQALRPNFDLIENRLGSQPWMLGDDWSSLDAYVFWIWTRVSGSTFDVSPYSAYRAHHDRMLDRPAVRRALEREANAQQWLEENGLGIPAQISANHAPGANPRR